MPPWGYKSVVTTVTSRSDSTPPLFLMELRFFFFLTSTVKISLRKRKVCLGDRYVCMYVLVTQLWWTLTPWTVVHQTPLSMEFSRWEYWHACPGTSVTSNSLRPDGPWPTRLLCPWNPSGKNTGVGSHSLLQENLPHPGNRTWVSCIAGGSFTIWATRGVQVCIAGSCKSQRVTEDHLLFQERGKGGCSLP